MSSREEILARLRLATADVTSRPGERGPVPVIAASAAAAQDTLELFVATVTDYRASVVRCTPQQVGAEVAAALVRARAHTVLIPPGLDTSWVARARDAGLRLRTDEVEDGGPLTAHELDGIDAVVTGARVAVATTGTIVLDHAPDQGRRALTLVPDQHVCVVRADQVVHDVPDAVALLDPARPLTWVSGPSATSDIELDRVEGVHGPRTLDVIVVC
ncbi:lactate utilization protein C [Serinicoccus chungangensis]|uniref:Lactate utilization protein C n=1 Tax=Serinicoccus chungangensis TaxID=767452 RepID=A0A0W8I8G5_9MICO|nr:LUD domain-containing protein [Serinicoccus chungangensis]KUG55605.1 lactate utilization protein C [Serinicoccus chungangensis]